MIGVHGWAFDSSEVHAHRIPVFWALYVALPSGVGTRNCQSRGGSDGRDNGTWNPIVSEMVVHIDYNMASNGGV